MQKNCSWALVAMVLSSLSNPASAQIPGTLIAAEPVGETPPGMQAWRISYWTLSDRNRPLSVTGMVVAPREAIHPVRGPFWLGRMAHRASLRNAHRLSRSIFLMLLLGWLMPSGVVIPLWRRTIRAWAAPHLTLILLAQARRRLFWMPSAQA